MCCCCGPCGCCSQEALTSTVIAFGIFHWMGAAMLLAASIVFYVDDYTLIFSDVMASSVGTLWGAAMLCYLLAGCLGFIAGMMGMIGAATNSKGLLLSMVIFSCFTIFLKVITSGLAMSYNTQIQMASSSDEALNNLATSVDLRGWNQLQTAGGCCGVEGYTDWLLNPRFNPANPASPPVPVSCCVMDGEVRFPLNGSHALDLQQCYDDAVSGSKSSLHIYTQGCLQNNADWVSQRLKVMFFISLCYLVIQIPGMIVSDCLRKMTNNKVSPM